MAAAVVVIVIAFFFAVFVIYCTVHTECAVQCIDTFRHIFSARVMALLSNTSFKHFMNVEIIHNIMQGSPCLSMSAQVSQIFH